MAFTGTMANSASLAIRPEGGPRHQLKKRSDRLKVCILKEVGKTPWLGFPYQVHV